ncbi:hypothetical protein RUM44_010518 [Polyplax serrata]|uniref:Uncharacterized protein n=1 Tax=Polyplax serrata TaxID=468196 RepID=A0ABR1AVT9_POLSC
MENEKERKDNQQQLTMIFCLDGSLRLHVGKEAVEYCKEAVSIVGACYFLRQAEVPKQWQTECQGDVDGVPGWGGCFRSPERDN